MIRMMVDWDWLPDEDPEEGLYEEAESRVEDEIGEFIESSYEDLDFLEILVEYIFKLCGVQLPLDADEIATLSMKIHMKKMLLMNFTITMMIFMIISLNISLTD